MTTVHLRRSDESVDAIIRASFPSYNGKDVRANIATKTDFFGTQWDEGNKTDYVIIRLSDLASYSIPQAPFARSSDAHEKYHEITPGFVVVAYHSARGREYIEIIARPENITPMLPPPIELTEDEETVLIASRSLKSSYAGVSDYRFVESRRSRGITRQRWDAAKSALIARKLLNKAGAITVEGKNAVGMKFL